MKFKTLMVCTILCVSIENSLSYAIIDDDRFDGSGDYDDNVKIIDNAVDHTDNYQVHTTDYPHKFTHDHNYDIENRFYKDHYDTTDDPDKFIYDPNHDFENHFFKDHYDLYPNDDHHDIDHNDLYDHCDVDNQHDHDRYDDDGYDRTENDFPDWSSFYNKKRSVSGGPQPRSNNILMRQTHGQPIIYSHPRKISGSHLKRGQRINKRRVMYFRGGQLSRLNLRRIQRIRAKQAMKKL